MVAAGMDGGTIKSLVKLLQSAKALSPMAVNVVGNAISCKLLHPQKARPLMTANVVGNAISRKLLHLEKV